MAVASGVETLTSPRGELNNRVGTFFKRLHAINATRTAPHAIGRRFFFEKDLKFLRSVMRRAVILRRTEQPHIVRLALSRHQRRDELFGRQTTERAILGRDNNVKAPGRRGDAVSGGKAFKCIAGRRSRHTQRLLELLDREVITTALCQGVYVVSG